MNFQPKLFLRSAPQLTGAFLILSGAGLFASQPAMGQRAGICDSARIDALLRLGDERREIKDVDAALKFYSDARALLSGCRSDIRLTYKVIAVLAMATQLKSDFQSCEIHSMQAVEVAYEGIKDDPNDELWRFRAAEAALVALHCRNEETGPENLSESLFQIAAMMLATPSSTVNSSFPWNVLTERFRRLMGLAVGRVIGNELHYFEKKKDVLDLEGLDYVIRLNRRKVALVRWADVVGSGKTAGAFNGRRAEDGMVGASQLRLARFLTARGIHDEARSIVSEALAANADSIDGKRLHAHLLAYEGKLENSLALHRLYRKTSGWRDNVEADLRLFERFGQGQVWFGMVRTALNQP